MKKQMFEYMEIFRPKQKIISDNILYNRKEYNCK